MLNDISCICRKIKQLGEFIFKEYFTLIQGMDPSVQASNELCFSRYLGELIKAAYDKYI